MARLNENHRKFIDSYLNGPNKGNGARCAVEAGYSARSAKETASRLLTNLNVSKAIEDAVAAAEARTNITKDRVMAELGRIAFSDIRFHVRFNSTVTETGEEDADGVPKTRTHNEISVVSFDELTADEAAAVQEMKETPNGLQIKLHAKVPALIELGKHLGIATKIAHTGHTGTGPVETITTQMTPEEAAEAYRKTLDDV